MAMRWKSIRVSENTHERLLQECDRLYREHQEGRQNIAFNEKLDQVSIETVLVILLDRDKAHRERARKQSKEAKTKKQERIEQLRKKISDRCLQLGLPAEHAYQILDGMTSNHSLAKLEEMYS